MSSVSKAADCSVVERLRDGSGIEIRAIRPADHQEMLEAIGRTSVESLQRRFFVPKLHFSEKELDFFINVDFKDHVALVAELNENGRRVIVGGGRYIKVQPGQAEMAFTVIDPYQGKGIGSVLMRHLIAIARDGGLKELIAEVLPENAPMLKLFSRFGFRSFASEDFQVKHLALRLA
jgi:RimJ/RimL family protein N-acetyltransferase